MNAVRTKIHELLQDFRNSWKQLLAAHVLYGVLAFAILTPLITLTINLLVELSGDAALSDQDILFFVLSPVGMIASIVGVALVITAVALQYAALMTVAYSAVYGHPVSFGRAVVFALRRWRNVVNLAARMVGRLLLYVFPFLGAIGLVYVLLLSDYDINYYLSTKPPVFWLAAGLASVIVATLVFVLVRVFVSWFYAFPLLLFRHTDSRTALAVSKKEATGRRPLITAWVCGWIGASLAISVLAAAVIGGVGRILVPRAVESISVLIPVLSLVILLSWVVGFAVIFFNVSMLSLLMLDLYRSAGLGSDREAASLRQAAGDSDRRLMIGGRLVLVACMAAAGIAAFASYRLVKGLSLEDASEIISHRGASAAAPENTMAAIRQAIADGTDWVEVDVQETADGVVVVMHDSDFKKIGGVDLKIWDATNEQLRDLDIGSWFSPEFKDERVPTLEEVLETCKGRCGVNIELKYYGHDEKLEERVVEVVEATGMATNVMIMSLDYNGVKKIRALRPDWKVGLLTSVTVGNITRMDVDFLAVNAGFASPPFIKHAHDKGKEIMVWTVNDPVDMSRMFSRGVDGIITDEPALAREVLRQRAALSTPERLLLELANLFGRAPQFGEQ